MRKVIYIFCFVILAPAIANAQGFDFYGAKFGMLKEEVGKIFKLKTESGVDQAEDPQHNMRSLFFGFDHKDRLFLIEAYYPMSRNERDVALLLAIKERFEDPIKKNHRDIEIIVDKYSETSSYGTSKSLVMKIVSKPLQNEYISYLKAELLKAMK
jgi:hypothetical protein